MNIEKLLDNNFDKAYELWCEVLNNTWPIEKEQFIDRVSKGANFTAIIDGVIVGFINCQYSDEKGQVTLILVNSKYQRQGVGTALLNEAKKYLKMNGVKTIFIGCGVGTYFWPGVPTNLLSVVNFFKKNGLKTNETNLDMVGNLENYQTPKEVLENVSTLNLQFETLKEEDRKDLIEFEKQSFPNWVKFFEDTPKDKVYLVKLDNKIVGSVILIDSDGFVWSKLLNNPGGFGALGVADEYRGRGIGLAFATKATEILKERGVKNSFLGWTYLDEWYGKLGYKVWREYDYGELT